MDSADHQKKIIQKLEGVLIFEEEKLSSHRWLGYL